MYKAACSDLQLLVPCAVLSVQARSPGHTRRGCSTHARSPGHKVRVLTCTWFCDLQELKKRFSQSAPLRKFNELTIKVKVLETELEKEKDEKVKEEKGAELEASKAALAEAEGAMAELRQSFFDVGWSPWDASSGAACMRTEAVKHLGQCGMVGGSGLGLHGACGGTEGAGAQPFDSPFPTLMISSSANQRTPPMQPLQEPNSLVAWMGTLFALADAGLTTFDVSGPFFPHANLRALFGSDNATSYYDGAERVLGTFKRR